MRFQTLCPFPSKLFLTPPLLSRVFYARSCNEWLISTPHLKHHDMVDTIPDAILNEHEVRDVLTGSFSKPLLPHHRDRLRPTKNRHKHVLLKERLSFWYSSQTRCRCSAVTMFFARSVKSRTCRSRSAAVEASMRLSMMGSTTFIISASDFCDRSTIASS